ncbi:hypothetical protein H2248_007530 [Termitomyces sp. 'cryptogamus']|nr:hypothetical protein H2248_007530 [Termitomyces sp. 'cryptogamus']
MAGSKKGTHSSLENKGPGHPEDALGVVPVTPMERQFALESALKTDPGVSRFGSRAFYDHRSDVFNYFGGLLLLGRQRF